MHFRLTGGHTHDSTQAIALLDGILAKAVIADKAFDSKEIAQQVESKGGQVVIPTQPTRKVQREIDQEQYKDRNRIERFFCRIKGFRRIATRYDKLARRFAAFVLLVGAVVWR